MTKLNFLVLLLFVAFTTSMAQTNKKKVNFPSTDEINVVGDLYLTDDDTAPFIILFHQAGFSRGEYIETAPKFNALGYNCLAIDQRSGDAVNDIINETHAQAKEKKLATKYPDAMPDLEAAIKYVHNNYKPQKLIIVGSSYSASLSIILASKYPNKINAAMAFSPGEYFKFDDKKIQDFAKDIKIPVFITSAKVEKAMWQGIIDAIPNNLGTGFLPEVKSIHGSRALWEKTKGHTECWQAVEEFLKKL